MFEIIILYVLNKHDATIYRLSKIIESLFFAYIKTSSGTMHPALKKLEKASCVSFSEKMSKGGMQTKTYSITPLGKKHLVDLLLSLKSENPYHIINEAKIALFCSDVLSINEFIEFKENILNILQLHKIKLEKGLENEYVSLNPLQKKTVEITLLEIEELIKII